MCQEWREAVSYWEKGVWCVASERRAKRAVVLFARVCSSVRYGVIRGTSGGVLGKLATARPKRESCERWQRPDGSKCCDQLLWSWSDCGLRKMMPSKRKMSEEAIGKDGNGA